MYLNYSQNEKICKIIKTNHLNPYIKINIIQAIQIAEYINGEFYNDFIQNLFKSYGYKDQNDDTKPLIPLLNFMIFLNRNIIKSRL
jgi:hypothetical protein